VAPFGAIPEPQPIGTMATTLTQKHLIKGTREFEIVGEQINIRIKAPFKQEERLSVMLTVLNPDPVIGTSSLDFVSRVNGEPLVSLMLAKPNPEVFNDFVNTLKELAAAEYNVFSGLRPAAAATGLQANVYEEPPEFDDSDDALPVERRPVDVEQVDIAIHMLQTHVDADQAEELIGALRALRAAPEDDANLDQVLKVFSGLGPSQGAVLTYAPYIGFLMSGNSFGRD